MSPEVDDGDEEGNALFLDEDESKFFSGFLTCMMVRAFGGRGRLPSNSARAEIRQRTENDFESGKM